MKIALTFDDGPHPRYTPQILDVLDEHGLELGMGMSLRFLNEQQINCCGFGVGDAPAHKLAQIQLDLHNHADQVQIAKAIVALRELMLVIIINHGGVAAQQLLMAQGGDDPDHGFVLTDTAEFLNLAEDILEKGTSIKLALKKEKINVFTSDGSKSLIK